MPVRPRPADIAMYNAWATRRGRPLWGESAAPRRGVIWGRRRAPAPEAAEGGGWRRGTFVQGQNRIAYTTDGAARIVAYWSGGVWKATLSGVDYYKHHKVDVIVNVPCIAYKYLISRDMWIMCTVNGRRGGDPIRRLIPMTVNGIRVADNAVAEARGQVVQSVQSPAL